jgi:hypothetical protein
MPPLNLKGETVKNKKLVDRICLKLRTVHAQFRKVEGHSGEQWNDRADALAVMGRNDVASWPKCSFEIVKADGRVAFRTRATRPSWTVSDLAAQFVLESPEPSLNPP